MSIATRIQAIEEHISDAYDNLSKFGVAAPSNKNIENIASLVNEIYDNTPKTNYASGTNLTLANTRIGKIDFKDTDNIEKIGLGVTNQDGEPTPDSPQDINVIKGNQNILVQNKNLIEEVFKGYNINSKGQFEQVETSSAFDVNIAKVQAGETYILNTITNVIAYFDTKPTTSSTSYNNAREVITATDILTPTRNGYIAMRTATSNTTQLEKGTTATSYVPHQENNYEIDLSSKNLFNVNGEWFNINNAIPTVTNNVLKQVNQGSYSRTEWVINNLSANQNYVLKCNYSNPSGSSIQIRILRKNNSTSIIQSDVSTNTSGTFEITATIPEDTCYIRLYSNTTGTNNNYTVEFSNIQFEVGSTATSYASYFTPIELCKINTYQDYIYKNNGNWYLHKEFEKLILKDLNWFLSDNTGLSNTNSHRWAFNHPCSRITNNNIQVTMSNILPMGSANITWGQDKLSIGQSVSQLVIRMPAQYTTAEAMKTALAELNAIGYALLGTPTETQITDTTLISQLNAWYNAQSMDDITYITVDGNLPMQLKLKALKK